jgi:hypothetical protein
VQLLLTLGERALRLVEPTGDKAGTLAKPELYRAFLVAGSLVAVVAVLTWTTTIGPEVMAELEEEAEEPVEMPLTAGLIITPPQEVLIPVVVVVVEPDMETLAKSGSKVVLISREMVPLEAPERSVFLTRLHLLSLLQLPTVPVLEPTLLSSRVFSSGTVITEIWLQAALLLQPPSHLEQGLCPVQHQQPLRLELPNLQI